MMGKRKGTRAVKPEDVAITTKVSAAEDQTLKSGEAKEQAFVHQALLDRIAQLELARVSNLNADPIEVEIAKVEAKSKQEAEAEGSTDDSGLLPICALDVHFIDESRTKEDRIATARALTGQQAAKLRRLKRECTKLVQSCRQLGVDNRFLPEQAAALRDEAKRKVVIKEKLEEICRTISQRTKMLAQDNEHLTTDDGNRIAEVRDNFQRMVDNIQDKIRAQEEEREKRAKENEELETKLNALKEHRKAKQEYHEQVIKYRKLELQVAEQTLEHERAVLRTERLRAEAAAKKLEEIQEELTALRVQEKMYCDKLRQLEAAIGTSAQLLTNVKEHVDRMTEDLRVFEEASAKMKIDADTNAKEAAAATEELRVMKAKLEHELVVKVRLEKACRILQVERSEMMARLKEMQSRLPACAHTESHTLTDTNAPNDTHAHTDVHTHPCVDGGVSCVREDTEEGDEMRPASTPT